MGDIRRRTFLQLAAFMDDVEMPDEPKAAIYHGNAERAFGIDAT
jgi:hypothetical protein